MAKKRRKITKKKKSFNIDLAVISLIILSILLFVLIYGETGVIGKILSPALGGIIGFIKYIIPIGIIGISICVAKEDKNYLLSKLIQYAVFLICIAALMSIYQISRGTINIDLEYSDILEVSYKLGEKNIGGGTVGTAIAYPVVKLLGMFGAAIALTRNCYYINHIYIWIKAFRNFNEYYG